MTSNDIIYCQPLVSVLERSRGGVVRTFQVSLLSAIKTIDLHAGLLVEQPVRLVKSRCVFVRGTVYTVQVRTPKSDEGSWS